MNRPAHGAPRLSDADRPNRASRRRSRGRAPAACAKLGPAAAGDLLALDLEHRRRQRLHPLQRDHRRLLRPRSSSLGLYADALFGLIAIINSCIGIRQELKAKETLDELAVLVAPRAKVVRDGAEVELLADEVVPGDVVAVEPGDQLVADGERDLPRGLTVDESMLTGEADGIRKGAGDRVLSGSFVISGSGYYEVDAVREESYAGKIAGEAKAFRHPPSPLQNEVNRVILACTYVADPAGGAPDRLTLMLRSVGLVEAAQTATAGLITLIPEGLVLLMSVTFAVAAVRLARRDTLVQQMSATESLAAVDTICVDKTGTLTDGKLTPGRDRVRRRHRPDSWPHAALGTLRGQRRRAQPHPRDDRRALPGRSRAGRRRGPLLLGVEVERPDASTATASVVTLVLGAPDVLIESGALTLPPGLRRTARGGDRGRPAGRRLRRDRPSRCRREPADGPPPPLEPVALVVLEETLRPDAAETIALHARARTST